MEKKILIISNNEWGKMFLSKHHYAVALAELGHQVYFLNPLISKGESLQIEAAPENSRIKIITVKTFIGAYLLRFKAKPVYNFLIEKKVGQLLKKLKIVFDEVWCYETNLYPNLKIFKGKKILFFPVDLLLYSFQVNIANSADLSVTISPSIVQSLQKTKAEILLIPHGLSNSFIKYSQKRLKNLQANPSTTSIKVGYVGNLVRSIIDIEAISFVVKKYPSIEFHFWGVNRFCDSNISGDNSKKTRDFIQLLKTSSNCKLYGATATAQLAEEMQKIDMFLLTLKIIPGGDYDGSNSHKIIEYLSTGRIILSNFKVAVYENTKLFEMAENNNNFLDKFNTIINDIEYYNQPKFINNRIQYALACSYTSNARKIQNYLYNISE